MQNFKDRKPENKEDVKLAFQEATEALSLSTGKRIEKYYASGVSESEGKTEEDDDENNNNKKRNGKILLDEKPPISEDDKENIAVSSKIL